MTKQEIGKILREAREAKGLSRKYVAEALERNEKIVGHWETGYSQPDANTLFELCDLYDLSIDEAFGKKKPTINEADGDVRPISDDSAIVLRKQLHDYVDSLTDEEIRAMCVVFKLQKSNP